MSTKIFNAYICEENYSMYELSKKLQDLKYLIQESARAKRSAYVTREFVHHQDFLAIFGQGAAQRFYEELPLRQKEQKTLVEMNYLSIWKIVAYNPFDYKQLRNVIDNYFVEKAYEDGKSPYRIDSTLDFNASVVVIPTEDKLLLMYFGNSDFGDIVESQEWLSDYHYQNQTDRPLYISDEDWEERRQTWERAIGPDYTPINHGMQVELFSSGRGFLNLDPREYLEKDKPSLEERAKWLLDYMHDYPNPPEGPYSVQWVKYLHSPEYLNWREERFNQLMKKLQEVPLVW